MTQWRRAAVALEEQHKRELRALSDAEGLAASDALFSLALALPVDPGRLSELGARSAAGLLSPTSSVNPIFGAALEVQSFCRAAPTQ